MVEQPSHRSLVVSLDGATWTVLQPLLDDGRLPNLTQLIETGVSGPLKSVIPPVTTAAWTSFQTGVFPERHGVYTFHHVTLGGRERGLVDATTPAYPTVWEYLEKADAESIVVNLPMTFPADEVPGRVVSGLLAPSYDHPRAASSEVRRHVDVVTDEYAVLRDASGKYDPKTDPRAFIEAMKTNVESRVAVTKQLMDAYPDWSVCMMHVQSTDVLQHPMWPYILPDYPDDAPELRDAIVGFYERIDSLLGEVVDAGRSYADELDVIILSDHGFQRLEREVYLDVWLEQLGFLERRTHSVQGRLTRRLLRTAKRFDVFGLRHRLLSQDTVAALGNTMRAANIAWNETVAWGHGNLYGYVYVQAAEDRDRVREELQELVDPETGKNVIDTVIDVRADGEAVHPDTPDLIVVPASGVSFSTLNDSSTDSPVVEVNPEEDFHVGGHASEGILVMHGPGISSGTRIENARLVDVIPTILHRHGFGVPGNLDGRVLNEALTAAVDVNFIEPLPTRTDAGTTEGSTAVKERLRSLGYVE